MIISLDESIKEIVPPFLENRRTDIQKLSMALESKDWELILSIAHNMKGSGVTFGFVKITELGLAIKQAAELQNIEQVSVQLGLFKDYLDNLRIEYHSKI